jgi:Flp pilus assembly protein TadD
MLNPKMTRLMTMAAACVLLAACQSTGTTPAGQMTQNEKIDAAIDRASAASGHKTNRVSLSAAEREYKQKPEDAVAATNYAAALREASRLNQASIVLAPFANQKDGLPAAKREYAAILLAQGNYTSAEDYAKKAVLGDETDYEAYHYLGIALDAQGKHPEGERAFRKSLELWQGDDPTSVMNNLALNLTAQGFVEEAAEILEKAKAIAPEKIEIERNLRIVNALRQSQYYKAPKPKSKPGA